VLRGRPFDGRAIAVTVVLCVWWIVQTKSWPDSGSSSAISSLRYSVVFAANLAACTCSVVAGRLLAASPDDATAGDAAPETPAEQVAIPPQPVT
jgi:hypothetical protein